VSEKEIKPASPQESGLYPIRRTVSGNGQTAADEQAKCAQRRASVSAMPVPMIRGARPFQDVTICGVLKRRSYVTKPPFVRVYLELSTHPPLGWSYVFMIIWHSEADPKPQVGIEEDALWVECRPGDLKEEHLPVLQKAIRAANCKYRSLVEEQRLARGRDEQLSREALDIIASLDLELRPRAKQPRRSKRVIRAYLGPLSLAGVCLLIIVAGVVTFLKFHQRLGVVWICVLGVPCSWVLLSGMRRAIASLLRIFRVRRLAFKERVRTVWPARYIDREGRDS
jgi:hypothetical protein